MRCAAGRDAAPRAAAPRVISKRRLASLMGPAAVRPPVSSIPETKLKCHLCGRRRPKSRLKREWIGNRGRRFSCKNGCEGRSA